MQIPEEQISTVGLFESPVQSVEPSVLSESGYTIFHAPCVEKAFKLEIGDKIHVYAVSLVGMNDREDTDFLCGRAVFTKNVYQGMTPAELEWFENDDDDHEDLGQLVEEESFGAEVAATVQIENDLPYNQSPAGLDYATTLADMLSKAVPEVRAEALQNVCKELESTLRDKHWRSMFTRGVVDYLAS